MSQRTLVMVQEAGTHWPIDQSWASKGDGVYSGKTGLLSIKMHDGGLIDPARCASAQDSRAASWELARTRNGTAITGTYLDRGAKVLVYNVRADETHAVGSSGVLPEVQATYVVRDHADAIFELIRVALETTTHVPTIPPSEYGSLDQYGHAAHGPVPVASSWLPVDAYVDTSGRLGTHAVGNGHLMLIGGGWLTFADEQRCCGFQLQPKAWRAVDSDRVRHEFRHDAEHDGLALTLLSVSEAQVWDCALGPGVTYERRDARGELHGLGAFWMDVFGQPWRLDYWLNPDHRGALVQALRDCCASSVIGKSVEVV